MWPKFKVDVNLHNSRYWLLPTKPYMAQDLKDDQSSIVSAWPVHSCRLDTLQFPFIKQCHQSGPQKHAFSVAVPDLWNEAPPNIQIAPTLKWPWRWVSSPGLLVRMTDARFFLFLLPAWLVFFVIFVILCSFYIVVLLLLLNIFFNNYKLPRVTGSWTILKQLLLSLNITQLIELCVYETQ